MPGKPRIQLRRIAVFCGSSPGEDPIYATASRHLGQVLLAHDIGLVYGGGNVGLMGILADTLLAGGGEVLGVIPRSLVEKEVAHHGITRLEVVETMHERKRRMYDLADGVIALPGGMGTLDELFEALTWNQLSYLDEPCGLLNVGGYYDPLVEMLDRMVGHGFLRLDSRRLLHVDDDAERLLGTLADSPRPEVKWKVGGPRASR
ncbi:MAG: TIGR00730 family Rossman fold protein [Holophagales bacterium]|nr:TIGR00730 family Rossman fold protein [Holophagales bacterium]